MSQPRFGTLPLPTKNDVVQNSFCFVGYAVSFVICCDEIGSSNVTLLLAAVPLLLAGWLLVGRRRKCPPRLEGHDEHSSFDQCDRPSTIGPIRKIRQSRFITVASGNVIVRADHGTDGRPEGRPRRLAGFFHRDFWCVCLLRRLHWLRLVRSRIHVRLRLGIRSRHRH